ncbi:hypothetical protein G3T36_03055 [Diaminobutyricibacter tongyongensis]|uniref:DUF4439 domain-containing protein n=1 Tax=Leifsonia tongyongensis TaxID=1268043 RepID=A0A6L9XTV3_9MICO|nr:hypothetical protein [Diaminobutyricibacter tongyongensis]NEN04841.1 hypothetical protein [Diaminobutyricibacter tongyongensis]
MTFTAKFHTQIALTAALCSAVAALLTGCTHEPESARQTSSGSIRLESPPPGTRSTQPLTPSSNVDSNVLDDARDLAVQACGVLQQSGMEDGKLPEAYVRAGALADQAGAGDPMWQYLATHVRTSQASFIKAGLSDSQDDFERDQRDAVILHKDCVALGIPLLDEHGAGSNEGR